jgi:hypothetical protein
MPKRAFKRAMELQSVLLSTHFLGLIRFEIGSGDLTWSMTRGVRAALARMTSRRVPIAAIAHF